MTKKTKPDVSVMAQSLSFLQEAPATKKKTPVAAKRANRQHAQPIGRNFLNPEEDGVVEVEDKKPTEEIKVEPVAETSMPVETIIESKAVEAPIVDEIPTKTEEETKSETNIAPDVAKSKKGALTGDFFLAVPMKNREYTIYQKIIDKVNKLGPPQKVKGTDVLRASIHLLQTIDTSEILKMCEDVQNPPKWKPGMKRDTTRRITVTVKKREHDMFFENLSKVNQVTKQPVDGTDLLRASIHLLQDMKAKDIYMAHYDVTDN